MKKRHPTNPNLVLLYGSMWNGFHLLPHRSPFIAQYLERIYRTLMLAVEEYVRMSAMRFDLHIPAHMVWNEGEIITRFMGSLNAKLMAELKRKRKNGQRQYPCRLRYVWIREISTTGAFHYHVVIFLNKDAFFALGKIRSIEDYDDWDCPCDQHEILMEGKMNMVDRIRESWASALRITVREAAGCVHIPEKAVHNLDRNRPDFDNKFANLFLRLSYFAKAETKSYGDGYNCFGCSRS